MRGPGTSGPLIFSTPAFEQRRDQKWREDGREEHDRSDCARDRRRGLAGGGGRAQGGSEGGGGNGECRGWCAEGEEVALAPPPSRRGGRCGGGPGGVGGSH